MSIEKSPAAPAAHKPSASAGAHGAKAKAASGDAASAAPGAGFLAILGDAQADPAVPVADPANGQTPDDALTAAVPGAPVPASFDASTLLQQNPQIAAALASQAATAVPAAPVPTSAPAAQTVSDPAMLAAQQAAVLAGLPKQLAASVPANGVETQPARSPVLRAVRDAAGEGARKDAATLVQGGAGVAPADTQGTTPGLQQAAAQGRAGKADLQAASDTGSATASVNAAANERTEPVRFLATVEQAQTPQSAAGIAPVLAPLMGKAEKQQSERERFGPVSKNADPSYAGTTLGVSSPDYTLSTAQGATMAPDVQVAEQVSYWVSQNVQNAELKLDGLGQTPVEVSIHLQGNEAQISFRSDEAATRGILESAGAHLKDILQKEGLVLTGVSVGTSGSGDNSNGGRQARQNVRQGMVAATRVAAADNGPRLRTVTEAKAGRSVDLFV